MPPPSDGNEAINEHRTDFLQGGFAFTPGGNKVGTVQLDELGLEFTPASPEEIEIHAVHGSLDVCELGFEHSGIERDASLTRTALGSGVSSEVLGFVNAYSSAEQGGAASGQSDAVAGGATWRHFLTSSGLPPGASTLLHEGQLPLLYAPGSSSSVAG